MRRITRVLALAAAPLLASCSRCSGGAAPAPAETAPPATSADAAAAARCALVGRPSVFGALAGEDAAAEGPVAYGAELGGAASDARGFVVGIRAAGIGGAAHVVDVPLDGGSARSLAKLPSSARPPLVTIAPDGTRWIGALAIEESGRVFRIGRLTGDTVTAAFDVPQGRDESEATAFLASGGAVLVAWDDADEKGGVGRIRARLASAAKVDAGRADAADDDVASPATSDASWPELVPSRSGDRAVLLWTAERAQGDDADGGAGEPSQALAYRWIEGVVVDVATGRPLGKPRALTSSDGHVHTFSATWSDAGLVVVVRDDPRPTDGDGGQLLALRAAIEGDALGEPARITISEKDVAPGVAALLPRAGGALVAWLDAEGTARLSPAFATGAVTVEPALRDRRVVVTQGDLALATRIVGSGIELSTVRCAP